MVNTIREAEIRESEIREAAGILVSMRENEIPPQQIQREEDEIALRQPFDEMSLQITGGRILSNREIYLLEQLQGSLDGLDFPHKLYELLCFPDLLNDRIRWSPDGDAFQIVSKDGFKKYGLKLLCKGEFTSFERKLQGYGFRKTANRPYHEYTHEYGYFLKAQKQKLKKIHRKPSKAMALGAETLAEGMEHRWRNVEGLQPLLEQTRDENATLRAENATLWAENAALRAENAALQNQHGIGSASWLVCADSVVEE